MKGTESMDGRIVLQQCVGLFSKINFFLFQLLISIAHDNNKDTWPHLPSLCKTQCCHSSTQHSKYLVQKTCTSDHNQLKLTD